MSHRALLAFVAAAGVAGVLLVPGGGGASPPSNVSANPAALGSALVDANARADIKPNPPGLCLRANAQVDALAQVKLRLCASP